MEGVSTVMPLAVNMGTGILKAITSGAGGGTGTGELAEARAQAVEAQAKRQAESEQRRTRQQVETLREQGQRRLAAARVAAAGSGLSLSGSSLLSLQGLEHEQEEQLGRLLGDSSQRLADILGSGAAQAQSIRLSGRRSRTGDDGLGSILRLGGQVLSGGGGAPGAHGEIPRPDPAAAKGWGGGIVLDL